MTLKGATPGGTHPVAATSYLHFLFLLRLLHHCPLLLFGFGRQHCVVIVSGNHLRLFCNFLASLFGRITVYITGFFGVLLEGSLSIAVGHRLNMSRVGITGVFTFILQWFGTVDFWCTALNGLVFVICVSVL
jgi:hypothetical protein